MEISALLAPGHIFCDVPVSSKKRALEVLSGLLVEAGAPLAESDIFDGLIARERLGSTGLGHGVAIPHGRFEGLTETVGIFATLERTIDYDAIDDEPVDLVFALMVPKESTEEHLQLLASLAEMFGENTVREQLRHSSTATEIKAVIGHWRSGAAPVAAPA